MENAKHIRWLYGELPELVSQDVVEPDVAERIRQHYSQLPGGGTAKRWATVLFGILGAALIGGGAILLLAYNWDELSRPMRSVISILPLAIAATLGGWLLWTENESPAWREGVGTAQTLAIGSSIALVAQTYNIGGRFDEFMLTWSLLALPIAYLLRATFPALLYLVGIVSWSGSAAFHTGRELWYFPLLCAALPFLWWTGRPNQCHPRPVLLMWTLALSVCIGIGFAAEGVCAKLGAWPPLFAGLFALLYLVGSRWWAEASATWQRPFQNVGALGAVGLTLVLSFADAWSHALWGRYWEDAGYFLGGLQLLAAAVLPIAAIALWVQSCQRKAWIEVMLGAVAPLAVVGWIASQCHVQVVSAVLFNLYLFVIGLGTLVIGLRNRHLGMVNAGMAALSAAILCRFFDSDLNFLLRGIAFILIGVGFLTTNLVLQRWKGADA